VSCSGLAPSPADTSSNGERKQQLAEGGRKARAGSAAPEGAPATGCPQPAVVRVLETLGRGASAGGAVFDVGRSRQVRGTLVDQRHTQAALTYLRHPSRQQRVTIFQTERRRGRTRVTTPGCRCSNASIARVRARARASEPAVFSRSLSLRPDNLLGSSLRVLEPPRARASACSSLRVLEPPRARASACSSLRVGDLVVKQFTISLLLQAIDSSNILAASRAYGRKESLQ